MSLLAAIRGNTSDTGQVVNFTFPTGTIDTTNLITPGTPTAFDLRTYLYKIGRIKSLNATTRIQAIVPSGCTLGSSVQSMPVISIANFKTRDKVTLTIQSGGTIVGTGGIAGAGGYQSGGAGSTGGSGGNAIAVTSKCNIINYGFIYGGGGGGGGGNGGTTSTDTTTCNYNGNYVVNVCGCSPCCLFACFSCLTPPNYLCQYQYPYITTTTYTYYYGGNGGVGQGYNQSATAGGTGGGGGATNGGGGGDYGTAGSNSASSISGGTPGYYINGISNVTFTNSGSVKGLVN